jgi:hypothetical protein
MISITAELLQAHARATPASAGQIKPPSAAHAYDIQSAVWQARFGSADHGAMAWKAGGPPDEARLTYAALPAHGVRNSPADLRDLPCRLRLVEAEIALRLGREVLANEVATLDRQGVEALIEAMTVSIEWVDSRWDTGIASPDLLRLADMQSHAGLVLGAWVPWRAVDWSKQVCEVQIGEQPVRTWTGSHSCADPAWVIAPWLRHVVRRGASHIAAGTVVTTGSWVGVLEAGTADRVVVRFPGIGEATALI